ncbi:hypothetical protein HYY71_05805 [Candidatus Woesearchaeota archaeon]|nr:hypothetical protein [Candidatus Woesearchaeota archaeon]
MVEETRSDNIVPLSSNGSSKRNRVGVVSSAAVVHQVVGEVLTQQGFSVTSLSLEELVNGGMHNFYIVDLEGLDSYQFVIQQIKTFREKKPDSELILVHAPSTMSRPQSQPLSVAVQRNLVPVYAKPSSSGESTDYERILKGFAETTLLGHISRFLSQPHLIKIGGSIFDLYKERPGVLMNLLEQAKKLHEECYHIVLFTGGGPRQVTEMELSEALGTHPASRGVLENQVRTIVDLLQGTGVYVPPSRIRSLRDYNFDNMPIPVVSVSGVSYVPPYESDTHTLVVGDQVLAYKVIFAKDTDGVFERDPYRDPRRERRKWGRLSWEVVADNPFFPTIYASQILSGAINRHDSEGRGEHLIETGALVHLKDKTRYVRAVQVINGTKPENLRKALAGEFVGSYILKG